jgi:thymidylate kinase
LLPVPDVCLFLDISVEESWKRRPERRDRYEKQREMLHQVRWSYLELFRKHDWVVIDAMGSPDEVQTRIQRWVTQGLEAIAAQGSTTA